MLKQAVCVVGEDAGRMFYAPGIFPRRHTLPPTALFLLALERCRFSHQVVVARDGAEALDYSLQRIGSEPSTRQSRATSA